MADKMPPTTTANSACARARGGLFLPSMAWTADPGEVEREKQRLFVMQERLSALVASAQELDACATWSLMAETSLSQLERDIDGLFTWLECAGRPGHDFEMPPSTL